VCVCVRPGKPYIMVLPYKPHKDGNIRNPCQDIFGPHEGNSL